MRIDKLCFQKRIRYGIMGKKRRITQKMELFLIRHGQSEADLIKVHEGRADFLLTEEGVGHRETQPMRRAVLEFFKKHL